MPRPTLQVITTSPEKPIRWRHLAILSLCFYALFLVPTFILLAKTGFNDHKIAAHILGTWQASFWHFPGQHHKNTRIVLDLLEALDIAGLMIFYWKGYQHLNRARTMTPASEQKLLWRLLRWLLPVSLILMMTVPFHSSDLYGYLNRGFQQSLLHTNPYMVVISDIANWGRIWQFQPHWIDNPCPYGFFFAQLANQLTLFAHGSFVIGFLLFKAMNVLVFALSAVLIYNLSETLKSRRPWLNVYLFAANPMILLHVLGNGHNDILMTVLLLLALRLLVSKHFSWLALPMLTLSVLTKYASLLAGPFMVIWFIRQGRWKSLGAGFLASLILMAVLAQPYLVSHFADWPWHAILDNAGRPQHSIAEMISSVAFYVPKFFGHPGSGLRDKTLAIIKPLSWGLFVLFYAWRCWRYFSREPDRKDFYRVIQESHTTLLMMVVFVSAKFHPWYVIMFFPLTLLLRESEFIRRYALNFTHAQIVAFTVFQNLPFFNVLCLTIAPLVWTYCRNKPTQNVLSGEVPVLIVM